MKNKLVNCLRITSIYALLSFVAWELNKFGNPFNPYIHANSCFNFWECYGLFFILQIALTLIIIIYLTIFKRHQIEK